ncbi:MAG TPA: hypothetical protein VFR37_14660 [Longimicrobium sp.]|nr:hypothetical protein [Longimicrobium sp.]
MIQEFVREMNAEERAWLQRAMQPQTREVGRSIVTSEVWGIAVVWILTLVVAALMSRGNIGGFVIATAVGAAIVGYKLVAEARARARADAERHKNLEAFATRRSSALARALEDGRVTVKRVHAVAVVEIEPIEDEGYGYVFDLGDGRVLFIKGDHYFPEDEDAAWPNTNFEIVRVAADGMILNIYCHGTELPPLRVIRRGEVDPGTGWDEREEVLHMSMDEAVRTVLRNP